jgi:hypothetical protein
MLAELAEVLWVVPELMALTVFPELPVLLDLHRRGAVVVVALLMMDTVGPGLQES